MKRVAALFLILFSVAFFAPAQEKRESKTIENIQKEYPLVPTHPGPALDEGSYSLRDEAWLQKPNTAQRISDLEKAGIIVGILLAVLCIFVVTGASDVEWEKKIVNENIPSDQ